MCRAGYPLRSRKPLLINFRFTFPVKYDKIYLQI